MITISSNTHPPRWMEAAVSLLLPPSCRETVLGDLQERFEGRQGRARWLGYVGDAITAVPQVLRGRMRRTATRQAPCVIAGSGDLRSRAEHLQTEVWVRNVIVMISVLFLIGIFVANAVGEWSFQESVSLVMTIAWTGATWRSYAVRGRSTSVPASLSRDALRAFHRQEVMRQMNIGYREFIYWSLPAALLIVYGMAVVPGFRGGPMLLVAIVMQNLVIALAHRLERSRYERELARLDQEVQQA